MSIIGNGGIEYLRKQIASGNPKKDCILWVSNDGNVFVESIDVENINEWVMNKKGYKFHFGSYMAGSGFVGMAASLDDRHIKYLYDLIMSHYNHGTKGQIFDEGQEEIEGDK